jgi:hypothetical protein
MAPIKPVNMGLMLSMSGLPLREVALSKEALPRVKPGVTKVNQTIPSINRAIAASRALSPPASCVVSVISTRL